MNKQLSSLLHQEMTRKEFLTTLGFGLATVCGLGGLLHFLTNKQSSLHQGSLMNGYGSSVYGGRQ